MTIAIACMFVVCLALPLILIVAWHRRTGATYAMAALGAAVFVVFARILEQLLHLVVLVADTPVRTFVTGNPWVYALYGGLAAGLFEECGRFTAFRLLKKRSARQEAVLYLSLIHI